MKRRAFITLLGGGVVAWPLAARAQQPERIPLIGVLISTAADDPEGQARIAAFRQGLQELGWTEGRNVRIDTRNATDADQFRTHAAELVALAPDVILAATTPGVTAVQHATRTVPIVFVTVYDPDRVRAHRMTAGEPLTCTAFISSHCLLPCACRTRPSRKKPSMA